MVTLPLPLPKGGLPVGLTVQGARFEDQRVLGLAAKITAALSSGHCSVWV
jgi:mandelamide amidase